MDNDMKLTANTLRLQSRRMLAAAERMLDKVEAEGRDLSDEENETMTQLLDDTERTKNVGEEAWLESELSRSSGRRVRPEPMDVGTLLTGLPPRPQRGASLEARAVWAAKYFGLDASPVAGKQRFNAFGSFLEAVAHSPHDPRLERMQAAANESSGAVGGFLVPDQLIAQVLGGVFVESSIAGLVSVVPMQTAGISIAGFNRINDQANGAIGGISFLYTNEAAQIAEKTPAIVKLNLVAQKASAWVPVSNELLSDSPFVSKQLATAFTEAARARIELDVINGSGVGQPLGIANAPSTIQQAAEGGQTADTINYTNIIKMASRLHPAYWSEAVWLASVATIPQLLNLQVKIQNAAASDFVGGSHYLVETDQAGNFRILGRPVLFSAACAALGDAGDLVLCAPSQYALGLRKAITVESSAHERFRTDEVTFRATMRLDGQPTWATALTLPGTASTVSWAVTLAAR